MSTRTENLRQFLIKKRRIASDRVAVRSASMVWASIPWLLLGVQWLVLLGFAFAEYAHFSVTWDFSIYHQAWYLIAHGDLNPKMSMAKMAPFYRNHLELLLWLLAPFYWVFPHGSFLLLIQDTATIGTEGIVWLWVQDFLVKRGAKDSVRRWLSGLTLVLLLANPWFFTVNAFDFHFESLGTFFVVASFYAFTRHRRWIGALLVLLTLLTGNVSMTYVVAAGLTLMWCEPTERRAGLLMAVAGLVAFLVSIHLGVGFDAGYDQPNTIHIHGNTMNSSPLIGLIGLLLNPSEVLRGLGSRPLNLYANLAPEGLIGAFSPPGFFMTGLISLENNLASYVQFSEPGNFQSLVMYPFIVMGTIYMTWAIWKFRQWLGRAVVCLLSLNVLGWAMVWFPTMPTDFVKVSSAASHQLNAILSRIPERDEVVTSQGIFGRFAARRYAYSFFGSSDIPVWTHPIVFIISPYNGVNVSSVSTELARIAYLSHTLHARLISDAAGIWEFRWDPPQGLHAVTFPMILPHLPAWGAGTNTGVVDTTGPLSDWHVSSDGQSGYVLDKAYWRLPLGQYRVWFRLANDGPVDVEIWNATGNHFLMQRTMPATTGIRTQSFVFTNATFYPHHVVHGWGPFQLTPVPGPSADQIEVRIWAAADTVVDVYSVGIDPIK